MGKGYQTQLSGKNKLVYDVEHGVAIQFPINTTTTTYTKGQQVKLLSTGKVEVATGTDFAFGYVKVANIVDDPSGAIHHAETVTVNCYAMDAAYGYAKGGTLNPGTLVVADGQNTTDPTLMDYRAAVTSEYANAIVVNGGTVGTEVTVLLLNAPVLIP